MVFYLRDGTVRKMVFQKNVFDVGESLFYCRCLRDDIYAVSVFCDHFLKASDLTLDDF